MASLSCYAGYPVSRFRRRVSNKVDREECAAVLRECGALDDLSAARKLHVEIIENGLDREQFIQNLLVQLYGRCGSPDDSQTVFDGMLERNCYSWTLLIGAYAQNGHHRQALDLFSRMDVQPDKVTFIAVLGSCASCNDLAAGRAIHERIKGSGLEREEIVGNALITMYGKCGSLLDARSVFDAMDCNQKSVVSYNAVIAAYAQNGHCIEAMQLYRRMDVEGMRPDCFTFVAVLGACSSLREGREIHMRAFYAGVDSFQCLANALVMMYRKFGSEDDARQVCERLLENGSPSQGMIIAHAQNGDWKLAAGSYRKMDHGQANARRYISLLSALTSKTSLPEGRQIHVEIQSKGLDSDIVVATSLVNMYGRCASPEEAKEVFDKMNRRDMVSWNVMMGCYLHNGKHVEAFNLYRLLDLEGLGANRSTFLNALAVCGGLKNAAKGRMVHAHVIERGLESDLAVATALVNMYSKCGCLIDARMVFDRIRQRDKVAWATLFTAYANTGGGKEVLELYKTMLEEHVEPDNITFVALIGACSSWEEFSWIQGEIAKHGCERQVLVGTAIVNWFGKNGRAEEARRQFEKLNFKDLVTWNVMLTAYVQNGFFNEAMNLYKEMQQDSRLQPDAVTFISVLEACSSLGKTPEVKAIHSRISSSNLANDETVANTLIHAFARCGCLAMAERLFREKRLKTIGSWTALLAAYSQCGDRSKALDYFKEMALEGVHPDEAVYRSILFVCIHEGNLEQGWRYFIAMVEDNGISPTSEHYTSMVDLLGRSGRLEDAEELLRSMPYEPDSTAWTALITACGIHGNMELAEVAAEEIHKLKPDCSAPYLTVYNMYAVAKKWDKVASLSKAMEAKGFEISGQQKECAEEVKL